MKTNRAYSTLEVKALDDEKRVITGIASTPSPDRMQDVVEPKGAQFKLPIPFLWQHNHDEPIGHVTEAKVTQKGIEVSVQLTQVEEPGKLKDRLDEAWQSIKSGLVRGLSIGFSAKEFEQIPGSWGLRFLSWEWFELSAVTIPANAEATITSVKSIDREQRAALGIKSVPVVRVTPAGASAIKTKTIKVPKPQEGNDMKTTAEQIAEFEATRVSKAAEMDAIMSKAAEDGVTLDAEQSEQFDTLESEVAAIDKHIARLKTMQKAQGAAAKPVAEDPRGAKALEIGSGLQVRAKNTEKLEPGIGFARFARVKLLAQIDRTPAETIAKSLYSGDDQLMARLTKAAVSAANTLDAEWAGNMINESSTFADFVEFLRPRTILGQVQDRLRRLPFDTPVLVQNSGAVANWVKEGEAKPVSKWAYSRVKLAPLTVAAISAATKQQLMRASAAADALFRDELARAVGETIDTTFVDPTIAPVTDESPGSIFNGVTGLTPNGDTGITGVRCDIATMLNAHNDANLAFDGMFWIMSGRNAIALSQMTNEIGNLAYPTVTPTGGTLAGFPVFVSNYAPTDSSGSFVALVKGSEIYLGDEGGLDVAMSDQASILMDTAPNMSSVTPTAAQLVSMFQTNSVAFRVERFINWQRRRAQAVAWMSVGWDACVTAP